ncbi:MAG: hypothetical protein E3J47_05360 [Candidatus Stahlbacteria bacterium]|jgi:hypothetical protein|nr:MAG: hypothetical protein E3J47_05360 [Candidatus Stahlbacteria bacterium]
MKIIQDMNERVRKLNIFDIKLVQGCAMFVVLIIVKLIPQIMTINIWWFVVLLVICAIRPLYVFCIKK